MEPQSEDLKLKIQTESDFKSAENNVKTEDTSSL